MSDFKVGEVCLIHGLIIFTEYNGAECTILQPLQPHPEEPYSTELWHQVQNDDGFVGWIRPKNLKRKQPPEDKKTWIGEQSVLDLFKVVEPA